LGGYSAALGQCSVSFSGHPTKGLPWYFGAQLVPKSQKSQLSGINTREFLVNFISQHKIIYSNLNKKPFENSTALSSEDVLAVIYATLKTGTIKRFFRHLYLDFVMCFDSFELVFVNF
jgi:hypothetical protein